MNFLKLTRDKLSIGDISDLVRSNSCDNMCLFVKTTVEDYFGTKITAFRYETFHGDESKGLRHFEMTCKLVRQACSSVENIAIYHRLGEVPVKEASLVIAISSPNTAEAFTALNKCCARVNLAPIHQTEVTGKLDAKLKENEECTPRVDSLVSWKDFKKKRFGPIKNARPGEGPKIKMFKHLDYSVEKPKLFSTQIKANLEDIDERIEKCMQIKRNDLNMMSIREFCGYDVDANTSCARAVAVFQKRKDSKSYLEVHKVLNNYQYRDNTTSEAFEKFIPQNGIEERLANLESQLGLHTPADELIYERIKLLEDRILKLESLSPEYIDLWERLAVTSTARTKRRFTVEEIDEMIEAIQKKRKASEEQS